MNSGRNALVKPSCCQQYKRLPLQQPRDIKWTSFRLTLQKLLTKSPTQDYFTNWRGNVKRWIESFLSHREQRVILDGVRSESAEVLSGVPQGTVLGPMLFLCFINNLPESIKSSQAKLFADDSLLFRVIKNDSDRALLQKDLSALEHWENTWQMSFNPIKCVVLRISVRTAQSHSRSGRLQQIPWSYYQG